MAGSFRDTQDRLATMYASGQSIPQISARTGINRSKVRSELLKAGVILRSRVEGIRIRDGLGLHLVGKTREFSPEHCKSISAGRKAWADENAKGISLKPSGYLEITRGEHKGRAEHIRVMEERIGRRLLPDEAVHHIDRDKTNNDPNNLALVTRSGHSRLHRFEDRLEGKERKRSNGRFS